MTAIAISSACAEAASVICNLMRNSTSDTVRLNAAKDILSRGGYDASQKQEFDFTKDITITIRIRYILCQFSYGDNEYLCWPIPLDTDATNDLSILFDNQRNHLKWMKSTKANRELFRDKIFTQQEIVAAYESIYSCVSPLLGIPDCSWNYDNPQDNRIFINDGNKRKYISYIPRVELDIVAL